MKLAILPRVDSWSLRERWLLLVTCVLAMATGWWQWGFLPLERQLRQKILQEQELRRQVATWRVTLEGLQQRSAGLPGEGTLREAGRLSDWIEKTLVGRAGIRVEGWSLRPAAEPAGKTPRREPQAELPHEVEVRLRTSYHHLIVYLEEVENLVPGPWWREVRYEAAKGEDGVAVITLVVPGAAAMK